MTPSTLNALQKGEPISPKPKNAKKKKKKKSLFLCFIPLGTFHISSWSTIVKVIPPNIIYSSLYVIAIWMIR